MSLKLSTSLSLFDSPPHAYLSSCVTRKMTVRYCCLLLLYLSSSVLLLSSAQVAFMSQRATRLTSSANSGPIVREAQGALVGDNLYVFSGFKPTNCGRNNCPKFDIMSEESWAWNIQTYSWSLLPRMPINYAGTTHCGTTVDHDSGIIYITSGFGMPYNQVGFGKALPRTDILAFDTRNNQWTDLTPSTGRQPNGWTPIGAGGAAFVNHRTLGVGTKERWLHMIGGSVSTSDRDFFDGKPFFEEPLKKDERLHWAYNLDKNKWETRAPMQVARNHVMTAVIDHRIYVLGGQTMVQQGSANQAVVEVYDTLKDSWTYSYPMPEGRGHISGSVMVIDKMILVLAGATDQPYQGFPPSDSADYAMVLDPAKGWNKATGRRTLEGNSMVCGANKTQSNEITVYCNAPDGVYSMVMEWYPSQSTGQFVSLPPNTAETSSMDDLQLDMLDYYVTHFQNNGGALLDISSLCIVFENTRQAITTRRIFEALDTFWLRKFPGFSKVTYTEDFAYRMWLAQKFGACSALLELGNRADLSRGSPLHAKRDYDTLASVHDIDYDSNLKDMNRKRVSSTSLCTFARREIYANFARGFVTKRLSLDLGTSPDCTTFEKCADFICLTRTADSGFVNTWGALETDCHRGVGWAAVLKAASDLNLLPGYIFDATLSLLPIQGALYQITQQDLNNLESTVFNNLLTGGNGNGDRERGARHAIAAMVSFPPHNFNGKWKPKKEWRDAFVYGLKKKWKANVEPVSNYCTV